ncbi:unnamed protein product [Didymodactylos carnosus]|uniref:Uncharacterized protein n=1 Tax=Didymodactylos carnosus TaxID=1234261 RepID=A0A814INU3_9BILA|nr:unnamed protein product [Didymodactylos carnosus]CAF1449884.1 unnamed protein product [Didymodactylos carnosus]CAF3797190.1 unnamed protein product [Didymodactylos carnosus]CAF4244789.1 unnamed protein product [Didymodactylos carnosus]
MRIMVKIRPSWSQLMMDVSIVRSNKEEQCSYKLYPSRMDEKNKLVIVNHQTGSLLFKITKEDIYNGSKSYKLAKVSQFKRSRNQIDELRLCFILRRKLAEGLYVPVSIPVYSDIIRDSYGPLKLKSVSTKYGCCYGGEWMKIEFTSGRVRKNALKFRFQQEDKWIYEIKKFRAIKNGIGVEFEIPQYRRFITEKTPVDIVISRSNEEDIHYTFTYVPHEGEKKESF